VLAPFVRAVHAGDLFDPSVEPVILVQGDQRIVAARLKQPVAVVPI
jgi:hypothetical protein